MGFTMASCSAYITMNGVMIPGVSAGSNHVGASEMCTPQVSCPSGPAARAAPGAAATKPRAARAKASRRVTPPGLFKLDSRFTRRLPDKPIFLLRAALLSSLAHIVGQVRGNVSFVFVAVVAGGRGPGRPAPVFALRYVA